ncbi:hypothetical protein [Kiloniella sp.]|uniref:hypothetical protein n=1 Tax=Kiloniella sp. TaxID=1938587 RepID=UPI003B02DECE
MSNTHPTESLDLSNNNQIDSWARLFRSGKVQNLETLDELENQLKQYLREKRDRPLEHNSIQRLKELISSLDTYGKSLKRLSTVRKETLDKKMKARSKQSKIDGYNAFGKRH